ncbi:hypothetical protein SAMN05421847_0345 [Halpernia humi]|uniref:Uncharacterized protein n=1 Tax=Halpernia humi TaxID=493375 RepID=A0A1H5T2Q4_9FLAO|nr:hypothetical protein [Halpernia humi]SEF57034.1 hypothetical protein SAMN05421847_0345 [Halpernia humi]
MRKKNIIFVLIFLILLMSLFFSGYYYRKFEENENGVFNQIKKVKKINDSIPLKTDDALKKIVQDQKLEIDSLKNVKCPETKQVYTTGFKMDGKSITTEELLKYVNEVSAQKDYYKRLFEVLQKKYNVKISNVNENKQEITYDNSNLQEASNKYNALVKEYNDLVAIKNELSKEKNKLAVKLGDSETSNNNLKTALELIKKNYNIIYEVKAKNDSTNIISVDKISRRKNK